VFFSECAEQHEGVVAVVKPRSHVLMLGVGKGLRDGFVASAEQDLVWRGSPVQNVDEHRFQCHLSDDNITIFWSEARNHEISLAVKKRRRATVSGFRFGERTVSPVWLLVRILTETVIYVTVSNQDRLAELLKIYTSLSGVSGEGSMRNLPKPERGALSGG
jgi:hypothetical protein